MPLQQGVRGNTDTSRLEAGTWGSVSSRLGSPVAGGAHC